MNRGGRISSLAASPTMVGAITVLIITVAVFLAYNAGNGLPFVPTYRISVEVPNAASLVRGNEVRVGGLRVGIVEAVDPQIDENGEVSAKLDLKLDRTIEPVPADSTVVIRAKTALGLKYLELNPGQSEDGLAEGGRLPLSAARPEPVEIDEVLDTFDEPTRAAIQRNLVAFGSAIAARGAGLNAALAELRPLLVRLQPVAANLASDETALERLFPALARSAAEVAPVAETQAELFANLDATFAGLRAVARPFIQETISESVPTLDTANRALPEIRPFLRHSAALFVDLEPGTEALAENAAVIADALEVGSPILLTTPQLNDELAPTARSLLLFSRDAGVLEGVDRLTRTAAALDPLLHFVTPAQSVCNYATLLLANAASLVSLGDGRGTWQRFLTLKPPEGPNNEGSPASRPANGRGSASNFLHYNAYPNTAAPGQPFECEAGNEDYIAGRQVIGNVPGNQGTSTRGQEEEEGEE